MDQSVIAGLGNIFRAELLYRARLSPFVAGKDVPEKTIRAIWKDAGTLMRAGMVDRRIVTTRPEDRPSHTSGRQVKQGRSQEEGKGVVPRRRCTMSTAQRAAVFCVRHEGDAEGDGRGATCIWCPVCQAGRIDGTQVRLLGLWNLLHATAFAGAECV